MEPFKAIRSDPWNVPDRRIAPATRAVWHGRFEGDLLAARDAVEKRLPLEIRFGAQKFAHMETDQAFGGPPVPCQMMVVRIAAHMIGVEERDQRGDRVGRHLETFVIPAQSFTAHANTRVGDGLYRSLSNASGSGDWQDRVFPDAAYDQPWAASRFPNSEAYRSGYQGFARESLHRKTKSVS
ncbi:hypothetical protein D9M73_174610 [compost metagenome]